MTSSEPIRIAPENPDFDPNIRGNVYHIVLDEMQTDIARIFLEERNIYKHFNGFTMFEKNVSNYLYTDASLPSYMTGSLYKFGDFQEWKSRYKEQGLIKELYDSGYNISFFSARRSHCTPKVSECNYIDDIFEQVTISKNAYYKDFIQIWFSRLLPNYFTSQALAIGKTLSVNILRLTGLESKKIPFSIREGKEPFSSVLMFEKLIKSEENRPSDGQYIYAHAILPHGPYVINSSGKYDPGLRGKGTSGYYEQVKCAFNLTIRFIEELKRLGRYDKSTIIIHADTGHGHRGFIKKVGAKLIGTVDKPNEEKKRPFFNDQGRKTADWLLSRTMALLMIKPANLNDGFIKSDRRSQLIDLLPTILDLIGIEHSNCEIDGFSLFGKRFPEDRSAHFFYWWPPNKTNSDIMRIDILDQDKLWLSPITTEGSIRWDSSIDFPKCGITFNIGSHNEGFLKGEGLYGKELYGGKSVAEKPVHWRWAGKGSSNFIFQKLRLREARPIRVTFVVKPFQVNINNKMTLQTSLSQTKVSLKEGWHMYDVVLNFPAGEALSFKVLYETYRSPKQLGINNDERELSVAWSKIKLENVQ